MNEAHDQEPSVTSDVSAFRIGRIYAEALLGAGAKSGQAESVLEELDSLLDDVFKAQPHLEILFSSAAMGRYARRDALEKAFGDRASPTFLNFLHVLNEHERLDLLRAIRRAAHAVNDERLRRMRVLVESAVPLSDEQRHSLVERIRSTYQMEPILEAKVVPELLGGMKVLVRDLQVDATVSSYLDILKKYFLSRSSHEIQSRRDRFSPANGN